MIINNVSTYDAASVNADTGTAGEIQDSFLNMLLAQIEYQDPLDPMENTEFTAQLAQINTVQQLQSVNENLTYLQLYMASLNNAQSLNFIGKDIMATGNSLYWDGSSAPDINYSLGDNAASVAVNIYDQNNQLVRTMHCGAQNAGQQSLTWNGFDKNGNEASEGIYKYEVMAVDLNGDTVDVTQMFTGTVEGLTFQDGISYVIVQGQRIPIGDIIEIKGGSRQSSTDLQDNIGLIGRDVTAAADTVYYSGAGQTLPYSIAGDAASVTVKIYNAGGSLVKTIDCGARDGGEQSVAWDGTDEAGEQVSPGAYTINVEALNESGDSIATQHYARGTVTNISYDDGGTAYADIGGLLVPVDSIIEIDGGSASFSLNGITDFIRDAGMTALRISPFFL